MLFFMFLSNSANKANNQYFLGLDLPTLEHSCLQTKKHFMFMNHFKTFLRATKYIWKKSTLLTSLQISNSYKNIWKTFLILINSYPRHGNGTIKGKIKITNRRVVMLLDLVRTTAKISITLSGLHKYILMLRVKTK